MILLGFLGLLQVCFLPGWLLLRFIPVHLLARGLLIFPLSLLANYEIVYALTLVGAYKRPVVFGLFACECALALWLWQRGRHAAPIPATEGTATREAIGEWPRALPLRHVFFTLALLAVATVALVWFRKIPGVFGIGDDILSWNRWALDWFAGRLPLRSGYYPQILPTNWSLLYQFTGTGETHIFAKSFMGAFAVGLLLVFVSAFQASRSVACLLAVPVLAWMLERLLGLYIGEGWVDIPLAFACAATWLVFVLHHAAQLNLKQTLWLSLLIASTATLIKQGGAVLLGAAIVWNAVLLWRAGGNRRSWMRSGATVALIVGMLVAPWFAYKWQLVSARRDRSEWQYQTEQLHRGRSYSERLERATRSLVGKLFGAPKSKPLTHGVVGVVAVCALFSLRAPHGRPAVALGLVLYLLWGCFFSYDLRNSAAALPFLALMFATGLVEAADLVYQQRSSRFVTPLFRPVTLGAGGAVAAVVALFALNARVPRQHILQKQDELIRQIAYPQVNAQLYAHLHRHGLHGAILTDYQQLRYLPEFGDRIRFYPMAFPGTLSGFLTACTKPDDPPVRYVLFRADAEKEIMAYAEAHFTKLFREGAFLFFEIPESWAPLPSAAPPSA